MADTIRFVFELTIDEKQLDSAKGLLSAAIEDVQAKDSGVMDYEFYLNDDATKLYAVERYKNSDAVMAHLGIVGETLAKLLELAPMTRAEAFGNPSDEVLKALEPFNLSVYPRWGGFTR